MFSPSQGANSVASFAQTSPGSTAELHRHQLFPPPSSQVRSSAPRIGSPHEDSSPLHGPRWILGQLPQPVPENPPALRRAIPEIVEGNLESPPARFARLKMAVGLFPVHKLRLPAVRAQDRPILPQERSGQFPAAFAAPWHPPHPPGILAPSLPTQTTSRAFKAALWCSKLRKPLILSCFLKADPIMSVTGESRDQGPRRPATKPNACHAKSETPPMPPSILRNGPPGSRRHNHIQETAYDFQSDIC